MSEILPKILKVIRYPSLAASLLNAQLQMSARARVPLSVRLRGSVRFVGSGRLVFGKGVAINGTVVPIEFVCHKGGRILIGEHTFINYGCTITAYDRVNIGAHCHIGHYTLILDNNEHGIVNRDALPPSKSVIIEDHVWIGSRVIILPGVQIGHHAVIGAGSVVTKNVPANTVAVGNPARVVTYLDVVGSEA